MATGYKADSGIGVGFIQFSGIKHKLHDITSVNSQAMASGQQSLAGIATGDVPEYAAITDIRTVNTQVNNQIYSDANITADTLCASADQRFLSPDCRMRPALYGKCPLSAIPQPDPQPIPAMTLSFPGLHSGFVLSASGLPSGLVSSASAGLSAWAITGIAAGAVAFVALAGLGGWFIYHRRAPQDAAPDIP